MIKRAGILILTILSLVLPITSAQVSSFDSVGQQMSNVIDKVLEILSPFFEKIIGEYSGSEFFFHKILLLILLIIIIKKILEKTPLGDDSNKKVGLIISILISVLAVRFISENNFFEAIFMQYGVLGIAITTILPLVIFFYFIHGLEGVGTYGRKVFWSLYLIMLTFIWISKASEIPEVANWIYAASILAVIVCLFLDKTIHGWLGTSDIKIFMRKENKEAILRAKERIHKLHERRDKKIITEKELREGIREEEKSIRELSKGEY